MNVKQIGPSNFSKWEQVGGKEVKGFEYLGSEEAHNPRSISWSWQFAAVGSNLNSPSWIHLISNPPQFDCKCVNSKNRCSTGKTVIYSSPEAIFWAYFLLHWAREEFCLCITITAGPFIPCVSALQRPVHPTARAGPLHHKTSQQMQVSAGGRQGRDLEALSLTRSQDNVDE